MTARMAYSLIYERLQRHREDVDRLRIDALLNMPGARYQYEQAMDEQWGVWA